MESYVMQNPKTKEKIVCYWYEALIFRDQGWKEIEYIPDYNLSLDDDVYLLDEY